MNKTIFDFQFQPPSSAEWLVSNELPFFEGHFPGQPVLPAVCILDGSLHLIRSHLKIPDAQISQIKSSKFTMPVVPGMRVLLQAKETQSHHWHVEWTDQNTQQSIAKIDIVLGA